MINLLGKDFKFPETNGQLVFAIDFDGTISEYDGWKGEGVYGAPLPGAVKTIRKLAELGHTIIIWTCRNEYEDIFNYLHDYGIPFHAINEDICGHQHSPKIFADVYIDDKNPGWTGWSNVLELIEEKFDIYKYNRTYGAGMVSRSGKA